MSEEADIEKRADEITDAKTDVPAPAEPDKETPLEEARRLKDELKAITEEMRKERGLLETHRAEMQLAGKGWAGQKPKTQEEIDQEEADKITKNFFP